ncbi:hypothetical protein [Photorhabdus tasmaniensis]|uniref:Uncharacterized protein n=1 Tax=Photorhabdus tasmaniensis TaxID=1004159 RepID=A0ABX0GM80_9GAMM|nr:hypothetical protein [Photorhabdus tasmaniensis]NHB90362.1 hypothetical protein [Photorhabdus tasmaniensis]
MIVALNYAPIGLMYGPPGFNSILSPFYISKQETGEFITATLADYYSFSAMIFIFFLLALKLDMTVNRKVSIFLLSLVLITILHHLTKAYVNETVCKKFIILLFSRDNPLLSIGCIFINGICQGPKEIDDGWLNGMSCQRIRPEIYNTEVFRLHLAFLFSKLMKKEKSDIIVAIDPLSCYTAIPNLYDSNYLKK